MAENRRTCFFEGKCLLIAWTWERGREGGRGVEDIIKGVGVTEYMYKWRRRRYKEK